jgi:hypothetical protein
MCWVTLTPTKPKKHNHNTSSADSSCVEELVRVHRSPSPRFSEVRVKVPSISLEVEEKGHHAHLHPHLQHHHRHPHLHPLHMHPIHGHHHHRHPHLHALHGHHHLDIADIHGSKLRGSGRKRCPPPPCPPPPSREPSRCCPVQPREPIYRTQIIEPTSADIREATRVALRSVQPQRNRSQLRAVTGYEVSGKWDWDCVSSSIGGSSAGGGKWKKRRGRELKYPPFGGMDRWL